MSCFPWIEQTSLLLHDTLHEKRLTIFYYILKRRKSNYKRWENRMKCVQTKMFCWTNLLNWMEIGSEKMNWKWVWRRDFDDALDLCSNLILFELVDSACDIRFTDNNKRKRKKTCSLNSFLFIPLRVYFIQRIKFASFLSDRSVTTIAL